MEEDDVYKIAATYSRVRKFLEREGWEFQGMDEEMDSLRNKKTGDQLYVEDISENFPVTFLMGQLGLAEFSNMARKLTPETKLL